MADMELLRIFQGHLEGPLKDTLYIGYKPYMDSYVRYRERTGPQCPFCKEAVKHIFLSEYAKHGNDFLERVKNGRWEGYS